MREYFSVILLAGGSGTRFGGAIPKQFVNLAGRPIMYYSLKTFLAFKELEYLVIAGEKEKLLEICSDELNQCLLDPRVRFAVPGDSRQVSSFNALTALMKLNPRNENVLIHDAARPFVETETVSAVLNGLKHNLAVDCGVPVADTIAEVQGGEVVSFPTRSRLYRAQTPQGFNAKFLYKIYLEAIARDEKFSQTTCDCSLVRWISPHTKIRFVEGNERNFKITTKNDLDLAVIVARDNFVDPRQELDNAVMKGKNCIVVGGNGGIGACIVADLKAAGANVVSFSRKNGVDICKPDSVALGLLQAEAELGPIDIIINAVGDLTLGALNEKSIEQIKYEIDVNFTSVAVFAHLALPYLRKTRGKLILFSSSSFSQGRPGYIPYSAAKAGVVNLAQGLAEEEKAFGVSINVIVPERCNTQMRRNAFPHEDHTKILQPESVANAVVLVLLSSANGQIFFVRNDSISRSKHADAATKLPYQCKIGESLPLEKLAAVGSFSHLLRCD